MSAHTKEPWVVRHGTAVMDAQGVKIGSAISVSRIYDQNQANAQRIVACVNACAGIDQAALEAAQKPGAVLQMIADQTHDLAAQRDALLSALEALYEHEGTVEWTGIGEMPSEGLQQARRQAAKVIDEVRADLSKVSVTTSRCDQAGP